MKEWFARANGDPGGATRAEHPGDPPGESNTNEAMNELPDRPVAASEITRLLLSIRAGEREAIGSLLPLIYSELRLMARRRLGSRGPAQTLDTTALVHEAYVRLFDQTSLGWADRGHFYAVVATAMRQIIVDHARRRLARKRGGGNRPLDLDEGEVGTDDRLDELLEVHRALDKLRTVDEGLATLVEMRYFAGFSVEETAEALGRSERTVKRDWRKARALLFEELRTDEKA
jgi:RNA polymerase sigma factor (TIGR02999 family)